MERAERSRAKVGKPAVRIDEARVAGESERHRVDREVATGQVVGERGRANGRQRPRVLVRLGAGRREIDRGAADARGGRAEADHRLGAVPRGFRSSRIAGDTTRKVIRSSIQASL